MKKILAIAFATTIALLFAAIPASAAYPTYSEEHCQKFYAAGDILIQPCVIAKYRTQSDGDGVRISSLELRARDNCTYPYETDYQYGAPAELAIYNRTIYPPTKYYGGGDLGHLTCDTVSYVGVDGPDHNGARVIFRVKARLNNIPDHTFVFDFQLCKEGTC